MNRHINNNNIQENSNSSLENVLKKKIKPMINEATERLVGVNIDKLGDDITEKLDRKASIFDIQIDYNLSYSAAKAKFRKAYLTRLLMMNLGNISEAAKVAGIDRRSLHRMVVSMKIDIDRIKKELVRPYTIRIGTVSHIIEGVLDNYKEIIHPDKLKNIYLNVNNISENIVNELPEVPLNLKEAEEEFEKSFFKHAIKANNSNVSKAAKKIGIRYETLHRKMKALETKAKQDSLANKQIDL